MSIHSRRKYFRRLRMENLESRKLLTTVTSLTIHELDGVTTNNYPVTLSMAFKDGDVAGNYVTAKVNSTSVATQTDVKNRYADGSIEFALLSFEIPTLLANSTVTIALDNTGTNHNSTYETKAQLLATDFGAQLVVTAAGVPQTSSARTLLNGIATPQYWVQGDVSSEFIIQDYSQNINNQLNVEYDVRTFAGWSGYRVDTIVDNTRTDAIQDYTYDFNLLMGNASPTSVYSKTGFTQTYDTRWHQAVWVGAQPSNIQINYNLDYLVSTGLIPNYDSGKTMTEAQIQSAYANWNSSAHDLMQPGIVETYFPQTGGRPEIGPLPGWTANYLVTMDPRLLKIMLNSADVAAGIPIHLTEADPTRANYGSYISADTRPTLWDPPDHWAESQTTAADRLTPIGSTATIWTVDGAHQGSFDLVPYLVTGDHFYLEEMQSWAAYDLLSYAPGYRGYATALIIDQTRGDAWVARNVADAAVMTPDAMTTFKNYLNTKLANSIANWKTYIDPVTYPTAHYILAVGVDQIPESSVLPYPLVNETTSPWMDDYFLIEMAHLESLGYDTGSIVDWMGESLINRYENAAMNPYRAAVYRMPVNAGLTKTPFATWADLNAHYTDPVGPTSFGSPEAYDYESFAALNYVTDLPGGQWAWEFARKYMNMATSSGDGATFAIAPLPSLGLTADTTAPSTVSTLAVTATTDGTATLHWTESGDNGTGGGPAQYVDVRYSTTGPITDANWASATAVVGDPNNANPVTTASLVWRIGERKWLVTANPGSTEEMIVDNLRANTTYYFAARVTDNADNSSATSNSVNTTTLNNDTTAPSAPTSLTVVTPTDAHSLQLQWVAGGDDGTTGHAYQYEMRYSTAPINSGNFSSATLVSNTPTPAASGTTQTVTLSHLAAGTTYYFAMKSLDNTLTYSTLSNVTSGATLAAPTVSFHFTSSANSESIVGPTLEVDLSRIDSETVTVDYAVTGGTATNGGVDYTLANGTLTFVPGQTTALIWPSIVNDTIPEIPETIIVTLSNPTFSVLGTNTTHTYTINDDDGGMPGVAFSASSSSNYETTTTVNIPVKLTSSYSSTVTVDYAVTGGTATGGGVDYTLANGTLTFTAGQTTQNVVLHVTNDALAETDETVILTLSNPINSVLGGTTTHTYTILDDDSTPTVAFTSSGSSGLESVTPVNIPVTLTMAPTQTVTVNYTVTGGTATGGGVDYTLTNGTLTFAPGVTSQNIPLAVINDSAVESNETVIITLSGSVNAFLGSNKVYTYTILDNDGPPQVSFATPTSNGSESTTSVSIPVTLSSTYTSTVTVNYAVTGGTATGGGTDYTLSSGVLTYTPGQTSQNIAFTVNNDSLNESNETIQISLSSPTNATLGATPTHTYTINDNDAAPTVAFSTSGSSGSELLTGVTIPVTLSAASGQPVTVNYAVTGGSATGGGVDYTLTSGTLTFAAGTTTQNISMSVVDDILAELSETVVISLSSPSHATIGTNGSYTYTITDNDSTATRVNIADLTYLGAFKSPATTSVIDGGRGITLYNGDLYYGLKGAVGTTGGFYRMHPVADASLKKASDGNVLGNLATGTAVNFSGSTVSAEPALLGDGFIYDSASGKFYVVAPNGSSQTTDIKTVSTTGTIGSVVSNANTGQVGMGGLELPSSFITLVNSLGGVRSLNANQTLATLGSGATGGTNYAGPRLEAWNTTQIDAGTTQVGTYLFRYMTTAGNQLIFPDDSQADNATSSWQGADLVYGAGTSTLMIVGTRDGATFAGGVSGTNDRQAILFFDANEVANFIANDSDGLVDPAHNLQPYAIMYMDDKTFGGKLGDMVYDDANSRLYVMEYTTTGTRQDIVHEFDVAKAPTVGFTATTSSGPESTTAVNLTVTLSAAYTQTVTVNYAVTGGTALGSGVDYTLANGMVTFAPGQTSQTIPVTVVNDTLNENDETIIVTLSSPTNATLGANSVQTYTIQDDDAAPAVAFDLSSSSGSESLAAPALTVSLSTASGKAVTVNYAVTGGTATGGGVDYTLASGTLTFAAGQTTQTLPLTVMDDSLVESNETIIVTLSSPGNATLGTNTTHTYTIIDNDTPSVAFGAASSSGSESVTAVNIPVTLSAISGSTITVNYAVTGGTATGSGADYTLSSGVLTFTAGQLTKNIAMTVNNDLLDELDETVVITLSSPTNATLGVTTAHTYTILDDDAAPTVAFSATSSSGSEATTSVNLPVTLSAASGQTITVNYTVTGGTATGGGVDYTLASGVLTFTAGQTTQNIPITVNNDALNEANETIQVTLSSPSNATLGTNTVHTYTINDNDTAPTVAFNTSSSSGSESVTAVTIPVSLAAASGQTVTVNYAVTGGTATGGGTDYTLASGTLTFAAGQTTQNISATIVNDATVESSETIVVTLSSPSNATLGTNTAFTYTIIDNDSSSQLQVSDLTYLGAFKAPTTSGAIAAGRGLTIYNGDLYYGLKGASGTTGGFYRMTPASDANLKKSSDGYTLATLSSGTAVNFSGSLVDAETGLISDGFIYDSAAGKFYAVAPNGTNQATDIKTVSTTGTVGSNVNNANSGQMGTGGLELPSSFISLVNSFSGTHTLGTNQTLATLGSGGFGGTNYAGPRLKVWDTSLIDAGTAQTGTYLFRYMTTSGNQMIFPDDGHADNATSVWQGADLVYGPGGTATLMIAGVRDGATFAGGTSGVNDKPVILFFDANQVASFYANDSDGLVDATHNLQPYAIMYLDTKVFSGDTIGDMVFDDANSRLYVMEYTASGTRQDVVQVFSITAPNVSFALSSSSGGEATSPANLTVNLSAASSQTVTVNYAVTGGTATGGGVDYTLASGVVTFTAGQTSQTIPITVVNDALNEANETIVVALSSPTNATLGANTVHTFTITDNDAAPTVAFGAASSSGSESTTAVSIPVTLSAASGQTVTVNYAVTGGTATGGGVDYTLASGTLTFLAGQTTQNISATIVNDVTAEPNETIVVTLSSPSNATLGGTTAYTYTINDDDATVVDFETSGDQSKFVGVVGSPTLTRVAGNGGQVLNLADNNSLGTAKFSPGGVDTQLATGTVSVDTKLSYYNTSGIISGVVLKTFTDTQGQAGSYAVTLQVNNGNVNLFIGASKYDGVATQGYSYYDTTNNHSTMTSSTLTTYSATQDNAAHDIGWFNVAAVMSIVNGNQVKIDVTVTGPDATVYTRSWTDTGSSAVLGAGVTGLSTYGSFSIPSQFDNYRISN